MPAHDPPTFLPAQTHCQYQYTSKTLSPHIPSHSSPMLSLTRSAPPSSPSSPLPPPLLVMQQCIEEVADDLDALSFDSSTTTTTTGGGVGMKLSTSSESETASGLASSSAKAHTPSGDPCWDALRRFQSRNAAALGLGDLRFVRRLGSGDIGSVYLVELKGGGEGCVFAAKVMDKKELSSRNKQGRARIEREILELLDHPFLPTLYATLDSPRWSCLLTDFCPGGDLHVLRQHQPNKRFDEAAVRFYASEVVAALEYLHMMGIIYRDLKPENVLVRSDGHIMLTDFDLSLKCDDPTSSAQVLSEHDYPPMPSPYPTDEPPAFAASACIIPGCIVPAVSCFHRARKRGRRWRRRRRQSLSGTPEIVAEPMDARSMSFVGTYEYLAPEIVSSEGHGNAVDWWTVGVFMYELFYGVTPFKGTDNELTLANIVARALEFPRAPPVAGPAKDLIAQLLIKEPTKRMGSTRGATAIKRHPFFHGVNWALLRCRKPPCVPRPMSLRDVVSADDRDGDTSVEYY